MKTIYRTQLIHTADLIGRVLLGCLFLFSGLSKIGAYSATTGYMAFAGIPGVLLPLVIALETAGGFAIIVGWRVRLFALLLAGFTIAAAVLFHHNLADQIQMAMFFKNFAIAGAFLVIAANGAGRLSLDARAAA